MDWYVKAFIRASLLWFTVGIALGLAMAVHPAWVVYRPAHAHMNVVGFITMMVFGVGYQLLPRLFGHKIQSRALAIAHWWLANVGLALMVLGFLLGPSIGIKKRSDYIDRWIAIRNRRVCFRLQPLANLQCRRRALPGGRDHIIRSDDENTR